jgi:hypothetical protein
VKRRAAVLLLLGTPGCGYALVGKGVTTDASIKRIGVPLFKDGTGKAGLDQKVTQKGVEELLRRGRFDVVPDSQGVDAVVEGELVAYNATPVGFTGEDTGRSQADRYSISLTARVRYIKVGAAEPIWSSDSFSFRDEYEVGSEPAIFFDREEQSMERLTTAFARNLVAAMLEAF